MGKKKGTGQASKSTQAAAGAKQGKQAKTGAVDISHQHASRLKGFLQVRAYNSLHRISLRLCGVH
jgi:hypothetical protein